MASHSGLEEFIVSYETTISSTISTWILPVSLWLLSRKLIWPLVSGMENKMKPIFIFTVLSPYNTFLAFNDALGSIDTMDYS